MLSFLKKNPFLLKAKTSKLKPSPGFSLIELIMVIAIFLIITTISLGNQAKFSSNILITNVAYQVALSIREAQVYGIGSKYAAPAGAEGFRLGYGIHIEAPAAIGNKANSYVFFADKKASSGGFNYFFDEANDEDILIETVGLPQGQKIRNFCGLKSDGDWDCWQVSDGATQAFKLNIVFVKPEPNANIRGAKGDDDTIITYNEAEILLESALGDKCRMVRISGSGQISVDPISNDVDTCGDTD